MTWLRFIVRAFVVFGLGVLLGVLALLWRRNRGQGRGEALREIAEETKQSLGEAKHQAVVEVRAARKNEVVLKRRLERAKAIVNKRQRREELLRLYQEASR